MNSSQREQDELIEHRLKVEAEKEREAAYQNPIHTYKEITEDLKRSGEECAGFFGMRRPHFESLVVNLFMAMERIFNLMNKEKSFRMEIYYDSEAQKVEFNLYTPIKSESDDKNPECEE